MLKMDLQIHGTIPSVAVRLINLVFFSPDEFAIVQLIVNIYKTLVSDSENLRSYYLS